MRVRVRLRPGETQPPCRPTRSGGPQTKPRREAASQPERRQRASFGPEFLRRTDATGASPARQLRAGTWRTDAGSNRAAGHGHVLKPRWPCLPKRRPSPMTLRLQQPGSRSSSGVEQRIRNAWVGGSIPSCGTKPNNGLCCKHCGGASVHSYPASQCSTVRTEDLGDFRYSGRASARPKNAMTSRATCSCTAARSTPWGSSHSGRPARRVRIGPTSQRHSGT